MSEMLYSKKTQIIIDRLDKAIHVHKDQIILLQRQRTEAACAESPIKPGSLIEWESGKSTRRGVVLSVAPSWTDYEFRCHVLGLRGNVIGIANVRMGQNPVLMSKKKVAKKVAVVQRKGEVRKP